MKELSLDLAIRRHGFQSSHHPLLTCDLNKTTFTLTEEIPSSLK